MTETKNNKLAQCYACNGVVSKGAAVCPHCGQKKPSKKPSRVLLYFVCFIGLIIVMEKSLAMLGNAHQGQNIPVSNTNSADEKSVHEMCMAAIKASVANPSTLNIHRVMGYGSRVERNGDIIVVQTFSAKNGFGLEKTYEALCTQTAKGKFKFISREQQSE